MGRIWIGCVCLSAGIIVALVGRSALGADLHPVATGLIAVGLVLTGVGLAERRLDRPRRDDDPRRTHVG